MRTRAPSHFPPLACSTGRETRRGNRHQHYLERGWSWPPRLASESFISYGVFGDPAQARARARLSGTVLKAEVAPKVPQAWWWRLLGAEQAEDGRLLHCVVAR
jgi:hypothetical protein